MDKIIGDIGLNEYYPVMLVVQHIPKQHQKVIDFFYPLGSSSKDYIILDDSHIQLTLYNKTIFFQSVPPKDLPQNQDFIIRIIVVANQ